MSVRDDPELEARLRAACGEDEEQIDAVLRELARAQRAAEARAQMPHLQPTNEEKTE